MSEDLMNTPEWKEEEKKLLLENLKEMGVKDIKNQTIDDLPLAKSKFYNEVERRVNIKQNIRKIAGTIQSIAGLDSIRIVEDKKYRSFQLDDEEWYNLPEENFDREIILKGNKIKFESKGSFIIQDSLKVLKKKEKKIIAKIISDKFYRAKIFCEENPFYYDEKKYWWVWNKEKYFWQITDEINLLNILNINEDQNIINSTERNEIINSFKQVGRLNKPEEIKKSWVQFGDTIYDIENGEEFKASPKYFVSNPIPFSLGESEDTPVIDKLFDDWVHKKEKTQLYEIIAWCCVPHYFLRKVFFFLGQSAAGKSSYLGLIEKFLSKQNISGTTIEELMSRFGNSKVFKKLAITISETDFGTTIRTNKLKQLSGKDDTVSIENKGKDAFDYKNYAKILIATNNLPEINDPDDAFHTRCITIDFPNKFKKEIDILSKIPEEEFNNLAKKCLRIVKYLWKKGEFTNEIPVEQRRKFYEERSDPMLIYLNKYTVKEDNAFLPYEILYSELDGFIEEFSAKSKHKTKSMSKNLFTRKLKSLGYEIVKARKQGQTDEYFMKVVGIDWIENKKTISPSQIYSNFEIKEWIEKELKENQKFEEKSFKNKFEKSNHEVIDKVLRSMVLMGEIFEMNDGFWRKP